MARVYDVIKEYAPLLRRLARAGAAVEDVGELHIYEEFRRLQGDNMKVEAIVAHLSDEFCRSRRTIFRIKEKFERILPE
jgi:hypothetical protein